MALLRGQGRFKTLLQWQFVQLAASAGLYAAAASRGSTAVALVDTIVWAIAVPLAARTCMRGHVGAGAGILSAFAAPWLTALPVALAAWGSWLWLRQFGMAGAWACVLGVGPIAGVVALVLIRFSQPAAYADLGPLVARLLRAARAVGARVIPGAARPGEGATRDLSDTALHSVRDGLDGSRQHLRRGWNLQQLHCLPRIEGAPAVA